MALKVDYHLRIPNYHLVQSDEVYWAVPADFQLQGDEDIPHFIETYGFLHGTDRDVVIEEAENLGPWWALLEESSGYNIFQFGRRFMAVAQEFGAFSLWDVDLLNSSEVLWASSQEDLRRVILENGSRWPVLEIAGICHILRVENMFVAFPVELLEYGIEDLGSAIGEYGLISGDNQDDVAVRARALDRWWDLVEGFHTYNLFRFGVKWVAIPQYIDEFSPWDLGVIRGEQAIWGPTIDELKQAVLSEGRMFFNDPLYSDLPLTEFGPPEIIEIEPIHVCNLKCIMCQVSYEPTSKERLDLSFLDNLRGLENRSVKLGAMYEASVHPQFSEIIDRLTHLGIKIDYLTNGTTLTPKVIDRIKHGSFRNVTVSFDGVRKETYEFIRRGAVFERTLENILNFKEAVLAVNPRVYFQVNYTVMGRNIDEIVDAVEFWEKHGFGHIGFISMVLPDGAPAELHADSPQHFQEKFAAAMQMAARRIIDEKYRITLSSPWVSDVPGNHDSIPAGVGIIRSGNPKSLLPRSVITHYQNGEFPGVPVNCRSPFKFLRINFDGSVLLCQKYKIGSIYDAPLLETWEGARAEVLRGKVRESTKICEVCDYYKFCIRANQIDYTNQENFISSDVLKIVEEKNDTNVLSYDGRYFVVPQGIAIEKSDLLDDEFVEKNSIFAVSDLDDAQEILAKNLFVLKIIEETHGTKVLSYYGRYFVVPHELRLEKGDLLDEEFLEEHGILAVSDLAEAQRYLAKSPFEITVVVSGSGLNVLEFRQTYYVVPQGREYRWEELANPEFIATNSILATTDKDEAVRRL